MLQGRRATSNAHSIEGSQLARRKYLSCGLGFRVLGGSGLRFRVQGLAFRVQGFITIAYVGFSGFFSTFTFLD